MSVNRVVFDLDLMRPGCALLQAGMGGTVPPSIFVCESWLTAPTPGMKLYSMDTEQLDACARVVNEAAIEASKKERLAAKASLLPTIIKLRKARV